MSVHSFEVRLEERLRKKAFAHYDCQSMIVDFGNPSKYRVLQERRNTTTGASAASLVIQQQQQQILLASKNGSSNNNNSFNSNNNNNNNNNNHSPRNHHKNLHHDHMPLSNSASLNNDKSNCGINHLQPGDQTSGANYNFNGKPNNGNYNAYNGNKNNDLVADMQNAPDQGDGRENDLVLACPYFRNELGGEEERIVTLNKLTDRRLSVNINDMHKPAFADGISVLEPSSDQIKNICPYQRGQYNPVINYADAGATYYRNYFYGREHQNWFGHSESNGPLAISIRKERTKSSNNANSNETKHQYRIIIRTSELAALRGCVYEDCIPNSNNRTGTKEVLEYLLAKSDIPLNKLKLGTPTADSKLLSLDEDKLMRNYKVGILYCKAGQSTEEEFYNNEHSGPLFEEFLSTIGDNVRLLGFEKFRGGLDTKSDLTGSYSVYSTYNDCEIMFHVSTMLPFSANNRQQLQRKQHIGNDIVTIVFQEEGALPFTPKTFRSKFQHVFIIVRALNPPLLPDGSYDYTSPRHYAVAVSRSKEMPHFGPSIPESGIFVKSQQFRNFMLAKIINAENAAHKYCEKFKTMGQRTRLGLLTDLAQAHITNTTLGDYSGGSNSGTSGLKMVSSLFRPRNRTQRRYANFCGHSDIQGGIVWDVQVKDFGQSNKIVESILGISASYMVVIEHDTKELLYATPVEAIMGWTSNPGWIKIFCHQAECLLIQIKDPDVDEIDEIVTRLKNVTNGCETRELTLRRKNSQNSLGFEIQPDGIVQRVDAGSIAWQTHLLPGSRLVEICKTSTATLSYSQMMEYIKTSAVVTLTVLPPNNDGTYKRGCLGQNCAHQPILSRPSSTFSSASSNTHFNKPKRRVPASLMTLV